MDTADEPTERSGRRALTEAECLDRYESAKAAQEQAQGARAEAAAEAEQHRAVAEEIGERIDARQATAKRLAGAADQLRPIAGIETAVHELAAAGFTVPPEAAAFVAGAVALSETLSEAIAACAADLERFKAAAAKCRQRSIDARSRESRIAAHLVLHEQRVDARRRQLEAAQRDGSILDRDDEPGGRKLACLPVLPPEL